MIRAIFAFILMSSQSVWAQGWTQFQRSYSGIRTFQVHSLFTRNEGQQAVFVKLFQTRDTVELKTLRAAQGWVHIQQVDPQTYAYFYFSHMSESEMKQFLSTMPRIPSPSHHASQRGFQWISSAHAQSQSYAPSGGAGFFDVASSCVMGVGQGVYDGTVGLVVDLISGAVEVVKDPIGVAMKLEQTWTQMKTFFSEFKKNMGDLINGISELPAEAKADMLCGLVGSIGTDALIVFFTAGGGSPKLMLTIKTYLSKIKVLESTLKVFTRFGSGLRRVFTADFYKRLSLGKIPQTRLNSIEIFGRVEQLDLAMEAAACAL